MICTCRSCRTDFWRYRRDWPPKGFCSLPCFEAGPAKGHETDVPPLPEVVLAQMRAHRDYFHGGFISLGVWYDCRKCDELDADYAASLEYHFNDSSGSLREVFSAVPPPPKQPRPRASSPPRPRHKHRVNGHAV